MKSGSKDKKLSLLYEGREQCQKFACNHDKGERVMKYVRVFLYIVSTLYILSFAKYNWNKKNKTAAVGAILLGLLSIALPAIVIFTR